MNGKMFVVSMITALCFIASASPLSAQETAKPRHAPNALPGVEPEMLTASYWIALQPDADKVILSPADIGRFNAKNRMKANKGESFEGPLVNPILPLALPATMPGDSLTIRLAHNRDQLYNPDPLYDSRDYYDNRLVIWSDPMKDELAAKLNMQGVPRTITRRFGLVVNHTNVRQYPTSVPGYHDIGVMLDRFQITDLHIGYPVAVLHESADGDFLLAETPLAVGWIPAADVALADRETVRSMAYPKKFLMGCADKVPVYGDAARKNFARFLHMSETMPLAGGAAVSGAAPSGGYTVRMGYRTPDGSLGIAAGYLKPDADVHEGWLPYTKRTVLTQMFKLLNTPYGWHGQDNKRDCVGTLRVVFRCAGLETGRAISRASDNRVPVDPKLSDTEKTAIVSGIEPVITVASNPGHTALLLGKARNGKLYFMHQGGWGYKNEKGEKLIVNRVSINCVEHSWFSISQPDLYTVMK